MIYGYIRVSTEQQHLENQTHEINTFVDANGIKIDKWVEETISSRKPLNERKLGKLLKKLKKGDILIATELSRLGRNCTAPSLSSGKIESLKVKIVPNKFCVCRSDVSELGVQITLVVFFKPFFKRFS